MSPDTPEPADGSSAAVDAAPTTVVFDVGEVIIDETRVWATWAELLGVSPLSFGAVLGAAIVQGLDWDAAMEEVAPNIDWPDFVDEHERRYGGFRPADVYPDVAPCMEELRAQGVDVVIAGNQPARRRAQLEALGLPASAIATSDDLGVDKPERGFWDAVMALTGVDDPARVLYVGDRVDNDVIPAQAYGMRTCWLRRGPWGLLQDLPVDPSTAQAGVDDTRTAPNMAAQTGNADSRARDEESPGPPVVPDLVLQGLGELPTLLADWRSQADA